MRVLILGGAGFLGLRLVPLLEALGHEVALSDNFSGSLKYHVPRQYRIFGANATDLNAAQHVFSVFRPEVVVVSLSYNAPKDITYKFYEDTRLILESANVLLPLLHRGIKHLYFCSSGEVYGIPSSRKPIKETKKIVSSATHHGAAKLAAESMLRFRCTELGIPFTIIRVFDLFGPRDVFSARNGVVSFLIDGFLRGETMGLVGATMPRDFIHVDDAAAAFVGIVESGFTGIVNLGTGKGVTLRELCAAITPLIKGAVPPTELPDGRLVSHPLVADIGLLSATVTGWAPKLNVIEEVPSLVEFRLKAAHFDSRKDPVAVLNAMRGV